MEVNYCPETPLLSSNDHEAIDHKPKLTGMVSSMKSNFFADLPQKLRSKIDPENPLHLDVSKAAGLKEGIYVLHNNLDNNCHNY